MARTARNNDLPQLLEADPAIVSRDLQAFDAAVTADAAATSSARALALSIGYEGAMTVGALEDEIRFYQRRTVEACLELGKRLLMLKEVAPHGEFMQRIEMLGFNDRTARRFMQAAAKTVKSANLSTLSTQVRSVSAFLELVTLDDDVIDDIAKMDAIDRMSASQLRAKARELEKENEALQRLNDDKNRKIDDLSTLKLSVSPWDEKVNTFKAAIGAHFDQIEQGVAQIHLFHGAILQEDTQWGGDDEQERLILRQFATLYGDRLRRLTQQFAELRDHYDATLSGWAAELDTRNLDLFQAGQGDDDDVGVSDVIAADLAD